MSPSRNDSTTTASYILILGSLLTIIPNIPVINEILPIVRFDFTISQGGANFLESYVTKGLFQGSGFEVIKGWTLLGLQGEAIWFSFVAIGVLGLITALVLKNKNLIKLVGLFGGIIDLGLSVLVFIGDPKNFSKFGLNNLLNSNTVFIGLGFWLILIGSILILVSGLLLLKK